MTDLTDEELAAAEERGREFRATHPHAASARYDPTTRRIVVELTTGATFTFPARLIEELENASEAEIAEVEVTPGGGYGLHWPSRDADLSVGGLMRGIYGTKKWMSELARRAGRTTSPATAAAARANRAKGGRPRSAG
jgi:Protein of unknown function (DUF2442)